MDVEDEELTAEGKSLLKDYSQEIIIITNYPRKVENHFRPNHLVGDKGLLMCFFRTLGPEVDTKSPHFQKKVEQKSTYSSGYKGAVGYHNDAYLMAL